MRDMSHNSVQEYTVQPFEFLFLIPRYTKDCAKKRFECTSHSVYFLLSSFLLLRFPKSVFRAIFSSLNLINKTNVCLLNLFSAKVI